jgi:hypothetical protein
MVPASMRPDAAHPVIEMDAHPGRFYASPLFLKGYIAGHNSRTPPGNVGIDSFEQAEQANVSPEEPIFAPHPASELTEPEVS